MREKIQSLEDECFRVWVKILEAAKIEGCAIVSLSQNDPVLIGLDANQYTLMNAFLIQGIVSLLAWFILSAR